MTQWLWPGRIPLGGVTVLAGPSGVGKSLLVLDLAARVSTARPWPDGAPCCPPLSPASGGQQGATGDNRGQPGSVILMTANPCNQQQLEAMEADCSRIHLLQGIQSKAWTSSGPVRMLSVTDVQALAGAIYQTKDCRLVVVDPVDIVEPNIHWGLDVDPYWGIKVLPILRTIAYLAERRGIAVLATTCLRNACAVPDWPLPSGTDTTVDKATRWYLVPKGRRRVLLPAGLAFTIVENRIVWKDKPVAASQLQETALVKAVEYLRSELAAGPRLAKELEAHWCSEHGGSTSSLRRAKQQLGVQAYRQTVLGPWYWRLPSLPANSA